MHRIQIHRYRFTQAHIPPTELQLGTNGKHQQDLEESGIFFSLEKIEATRKEHAPKPAISRLREPAGGSRCACGQWNYPALASFGTGEKGPLTYDTPANPARPVPPATRTH